MNLSDCDFSGIIYKIDSSFSDASEHATVYQASETNYLNEILDKSSQDKKTFQFFVDVGSGKGKACLIASKSKKFEKIIGVEISEPLIKIAIKNLKIAKCDDVTFLNEDIGKFKIPNGKTLFYIYNPFDSDVLKAFIEINRDYIKQTNSVIGYLNDVHSSVLKQAGFETLYKNKRNSISIWQ
jgi:predicted RNA methylase